MNFSVISEQDAIAKYKNANNKILAIRIISDLTASTKDEVAEFLWVKLIKEYPLVLEE